jgi:hypothetical protein
MGLGSLNTISLSQAREEAGRWRGVLKEAETRSMSATPSARRSNSRPLGRSRSRLRGAQFSAWRLTSRAGATRNTGNSGTICWRGFQFPAFTFSISPGVTLYPSIDSE